MLCSANAANFACFSLRSKLIYPLPMSFEQFCKLEKKRRNRKFVNKNTLLTMIFGHSDVNKSITRLIKLRHFVMILTPTRARKFCRRARHFPGGTCEVRDLFPLVRGPVAGLPPRVAGVSLIDPVYMNKHNLNCITDKSIRSIIETNRTFDSCNSCKRLDPAQKLHESKLPLTWLIGFIRFELCFYVLM